MELFKKISTLLMVLVLLVATTGVTMHKHYCMGRLKAVSFFKKAESCLAVAGMEEKEACPMSCCKDTVEELKLEELQKAHFDFSATPNFSQVAVITYLLIEVDLVSLSASHDHYLHYKPPLIDRDIPVLVQSFLL